MLFARKRESKQSKFSITIGLDRRFHFLLQFLQSRQEFGVAARLLLARVDLLSEVAGMLQRHRDFTQSCCKLRSQSKLPVEHVLRRFHTRIQLDRQRLRAALAVRRELHRVVSWRR